MNTMLQADLRAMLQAKREHDEAVRDERAARKAYLQAQERFLGHYPRCSPPGPIICGDVFITVTDGWERADQEFKFKYTEAERCPTSE